LRILVEVHW